MKHKQKETDKLFLKAGEGRVYKCGTMTAVFKADENETAYKYSISEWWIEPNAADQVHTITKTMTEYSTAWKAPHQYLSATNGSMWKKEHF